MSRALRLALAAGLAPAVGLCLTPSAKGQFSWTNPVSGNWSDSSKWTPTGVPSGAGATATLGLAGAYTVSNGLSQTLGGLTITNAAATLNLLDNSFLILPNNTTPNAGTIVINSTAGTTGSFIRIDSAGTLGSSGGLVRINANSGNPNTAFIQANSTGVDNVAGHTIAGEGRIIGPWTNDGVIAADVSGLTLTMDSGNRTNNNILEGIAGGTLFLSGNTTTQGAGGRIVASGGTVTLSSCTTLGGTVEQLAGGSVLYQGTNTFGSVQPIGPLSLPDNTALLCSGTTTVFNHDSLMTVNTTAGANGAYVRFDAPTTAFGGTGTTLLNASSNLNTAFVQANGGPVTQGAGRTVHGTGRIIGPWINNGLISGDVSGATLQMDGGNRTNNNIIQGTAGGTLFLSGSATTQGAGGRLIAQGGTLTLSSCTTIGGTVEQLAGGTVLYEGTNTFTSVQPIGPLVLPDNTNIINTTATLNHDSTMTINATAGANGAYIRFDAGATSFGGTGTTLLNAPASIAGAYVQANGGPVTQGAGRTIHGTGRVIGPWINNGLISADANGKTLQMDGGNRTNNNIIQGTAGGTLFLSGNTTTQGAVGRLIAQGGTLTLSACTTIGGTVEQLAGGTVLYEGTNTFTNVQPIGPITLPDNTFLISSATSPTFNHDSVMTINSTAGANGAYLRFDAPATAFGGTGTTLLNAGPNINTASVVANGGPVTQGAGRTIHGTGRIAGTWTNNGVISADAGGKTLQMDGGNRANNNIIQGTGGGTLFLSGSTTTQGAGGRLVAQGGTLTLSSCVTNGGTVEQLAGGTVLFQGSNTWSGVQPIGPLTLPDNTNLLLSSAAMNHDSTLEVNGTAGPNGAFIRCDAAATTLGGNGELLLNAGSNPATAYLQANGGPVTHGPNRAVRGNGELLGNQTVQGTIAPGLAAGATGTINASSGTLTLASSTTVNIELGGTPASGLYDSIVGNSTKVQAGTLNVSLVNAYVPAASAIFSVVTGSSISGPFTTVNLPTVGAFGPAHVVYTPTATEVVMCYANCDGSTTPPALNVLDFACFLNMYAAADPAANCDGSTTPPVLNVLDFACFLNKYAAGCP